MIINGLAHPISIGILGLAGFIYYRLIYARLVVAEACLENCLENLQFWQQSLRLCIGALPLLGLLGTIMGLMDAFTAMARGEVVSGVNQLTSGISSALFTTQLGLLFAVPAWILFAVVNKAIINSLNERGGVACK